LNGSWGFDNRGRIIGSFLEIVAPKPIVSCTTNENITTVYQTTTVPVTNPDGSVTYFQTNITTFVTNAPTIICATNSAGTGFTNVVNFVGKVVPGKRLALVASSSIGSFILRGVPATNLIDLSGSWYGLKTQNRVAAWEFFELEEIFPEQNTYSVNGLGPDYSYNDGIAIVSSQRQIAFAFDLLAATQYRSTRAVMGPFNPRTLTARTVGVESPGGPASLTNRVTFQVVKRSSVP